MELPQLFSYEDLVEGMSRERDYVITREVYEGFLGLFGDASPLHVDVGYASACGFESRSHHQSVVFSKPKVGGSNPLGRTNNR